MIRTLRAETLKLATLPATWIATALMMLLPALLAAANANFLARTLRSGNTGGLLTTSTVDEGFGQLTYGLVGVAVLGVTAISSEYARNARTVGSGRQVTTSATAAPRRLQLLTAKLAVLTGWVLACGAVAIPVTVAASRRLLGSWATPWSDDFWARGFHAGLFWVAMSWIAFGITCLARNGIIPLALLITNASMVSFSLLAAKVTSWARFLPDMAAYPSFLTANPMSHPLSAGTGMLVMAAWSVGCVLAAMVAFARRDV